MEVALETYESDSDLWERDGPLLEPGTALSLYPLPRAGGISCTKNRRELSRGIAVERGYPTHHPVGARKWVLEINLFWGPLGAGAIQS